jgi:alpha-glucosidase
MCRWGYRDVDTLSQVVANYSAAGLPLETLWSDIEYMPKRFWTMEMDEREWGGVLQAIPCTADWYLHIRYIGDTGDSSSARQR